MTREQMIDAAVREAHGVDDFYLLPGVLLFAQREGIAVAERICSYSIPAIRKAFARIAARQN